MYPNGSAATRRHGTRAITFLGAVWIAATAAAHGPADAPAADAMVGGRAIEFPDTADRLTLTVDLHTHSVFSDGHVWPRIRVGEALRDGLDAMAITEHLEWQPHLADIPHPDRNRAYEEALASLPDGADLIVIAGSEITRLAPHGHMNAVFIQDANALVAPGTPPVPFDPRAYFVASATLTPEAVLDAAAAQGAFVFWNHSWSDFPNAMTELTDFHRSAVEAGKLHGIEIANGDTYSPESFRIALTHGLTPIGVSDVHNLIDWDYEPHRGGHRPVNLVFASARSAAAIRQALFDGRTVVWFRNLLLGRERDLEPLIRACMAIESAAYLGDGSVLELAIRNRSDARFELGNESPYTLVGDARLDVAPHAVSTFRIRTPERVESVDLPLKVLNALSAPDTHPTLTFRVTTGYAPEEDD
jgi:hypothetical protein